jgi:hypothetical protein
LHTWVPLMRRLAALALVLFLGLAASPAAAQGESDGDALYSVITYADREYTIGSNVDIVVHVFESGHYTPGAAVELTVGPYYPNPRTVNVTEQGTGTWKGNFTIEQGDVTRYDQLGSGGFVMASAKITKGTADEYASTTIELAASEPEGRFTLSTRVSPASIYVSPGESRTVTWEARYNGNLVDASSVELSVDYDVVAPPQKTGVGTYQWSKTWSSATRSTDTYVELSATYAPSGGSELQDSESVSFYLTFMHVWAKRVGLATSTGATFDLYVSNRTGAALEGATVLLNYSYQDDDDEYIEKNLTASTDVNGMARATLSYNDLGLDQENVDIEGEVRAQGKVQSIEFQLNVRTIEDKPPAPDTTGLDLVPAKDYYAQFDKPFTFSGVTYFHGDPMPSAKVAYYFATPYAVFALGNVTTQASGSMSVALTPPKKALTDPTRVDAHFEYGAPGGGDVQYYSDDEYIYVSSTDVTQLQQSESISAIITYYGDDDVSVKVAKLKKGEPVQVTVSYAGADAQWQGMVLFGADPNPADLGLVPEWTYWTESMSSGLYMDRCEFSDGKFQGAVFVPQNLPDKQFYVIGAVMNTDIVPSELSDMRDYFKTNVVDGLEVGKSGGDGGDDEQGGLAGLMDKEFLGLPLLYLIIIIVVIAIVGLLAGWMVARSKRAKAAPAVEAAHEEPHGPRFESGPGPAAAMPMQTYSPEPQPQYAPQPAYQQQPEYQQQAVYQQSAPQPQYQQPAPQPQYQQPAPPPPPPPPPPAQPTPAYQMPQQQPAYRAPATAQPAPAPAPAPAVAPAAAAATAEGMMTIKCQKCGTHLQIPRKRPIKVTCPKCGASGVLR